MARFGVKEVSNVTLYDLLTGKPDLFLDTLKLSNLENSAESAYATGGQGAGRLVGWDFSRTANFNVQDALLNPKAIAMQVGNALEKKIAKIFKREYAIAKAGQSGKATIQLAEIPLEGTVHVYMSEDGYEHGKEVLGTTIVGETLQAEITALPVDSKVLVYYQFETESEAEVIRISSDKFAGYYMVVGDTLWRNEKTGKDELVQLVIAKAKLTSAFTITMQPDGEPSVFDFNLEVFKASDSTDMVELIRYA